MTKIDPSAELINALRAQLTSRAAAQKRAGSPEARNAAEADTQPAVASPQEIKKRIGRQIKNLDLTTEATRRQARMIFLESILAWDFGDQVMTDGRFGFIVRDIDESLRADPDVSKSFDLLLESIQATSD